MRNITRSLALILVLTCLCGCSQTQSASTGGNPTDPTAGATEPTASLWTTVDFEALLREDMFPAEDPLSKDLNEAVVISELSVTENAVSFLLEAPDISQALIEWYDAQPTFDEAALEDQIRVLLKGEKTVAEISLPFTVRGDIITVSYTEEALTAFGCGVRQFHTMLYERVYEAIGGAGDD